MLKLPNVTLFQADKDGRESTAFDACKDIQFAEVILETSLDSYEAYNKFIVTELYKCFSTDFVMVVQHDGYPVDLAKWEDAFLEYDYIGAPWDDGVVGNGGFSIRSKRFCELTAEIEANQYSPEDQLLCRVNRAWLEEQGMKFAPEEVAKRFSWEWNTRYRSYEGQFGFHNIKPTLNPVYDSVDVDSVAMLVKHISSFGPRTFTTDNGILANYLTSVGYVPGNGIYVHTSQQPINGAYVIEHGAPKSLDGLEVIKTEFGYTIYRKNG